jgi:hypothetical protein
MNTILPYFIEWEYVSLLSMEFILTLMQMCNEFVNSILMHYQFNCEFTFFFYLPSFWLLPFPRSSENPICKSVYLFSITYIALVERKPASAVNWQQWQLMGIMTSSLLEVEWLEVQ